MACRAPLTYSSILLLRNRLQRTDRKLGQGPCNSNHWQPLPCYRMRPSCVWWPIWPWPTSRYGTNFLKHKWSNKFHVYICSKNNLKWKKERMIKKYTKWPRNKIINVHFSVYSNYKCKVYVENCCLLFEIKKEVAIV